MPILVIFLNSAMTHIKPAIQEDSLLMLDILLKHAPQLVASQKETILTPYLDMVSKKRNENNLSERSLSLQMGNKITSTKWRTSVLQRLIQFLIALIIRIKLYAPPMNEEYRWILMKSK